MAHRAPSPMNMPDSGDRPPRPSPALGKSGCRKVIAGILVAAGTVVLLGLLQIEEWASVGVIVAGGLVAAVLTYGGVLQLRGQVEPEPVTEIDSKIKWPVQAESESDPGCVCGGASPDELARNVEEWDSSEGVEDVCLYDSDGRRLSGRISLMEGVVILKVDCGTQRQ